MALSQRLDLRQSQSLVMTPQLQQAIKLLQLSNLELNDYVERELEQNPLLERDESDPDGTAPAEAPAAPVEQATTQTLDKSKTEFDGDDANVWQAESGAEGEGMVDYGGDPEAWKSSSSGRFDADDLPGLEETLRQGITLREHLIEQVNCDLEIGLERAIGLFMIDLLDDAGYLAAEPAQIAAMLGTTEARVLEVLAKVQNFEPTGIFARNLAECLAIQLRELKRLDPCMQALLDNLPLLAARDLAQLKRACAVDAEDLAEMIAEIRALSPKPGWTFDGRACPAGRARHPDARAAKRRLAARAQ